jgi:hypothetical protein
MANHHWQCGNCSATALASWQSGISAASCKREQSVCSLGPSEKEFNQSTIIKFTKVRVPEHDMTMFFLKRIHKVRASSECPSLLKCSCEIDTRYKNNFKLSSTKVRFFQSQVLPKSGSLQNGVLPNSILPKSGLTKVMFYQSHVLPKSAPKWDSTKLFRSTKGMLYLSPVCFKMRFYQILLY